MPHSGRVDCLAYAQGPRRAGAIVIEAVVILLCLWPISALVYELVQDFHDRARRNRRNRAGLMRDFRGTINRN